MLSIDFKNASCADFASCADLGHIAVKIKKKKLKKNTSPNCARDKAYLFLKATAASLAPRGPTQTLFSGYRRTFPKRKHESAHSPLSQADVTNKLVYTSS